ncbi:hypothetical protein MRB53_033991 [Persea americana]|uniref:Uncharacterized protein n=1 Tax=Persea americana TaxID=3435 RepID=A0ACC2KX54_PERAE|nr:hypothetical protein MRB53_033991 [Persea americana]
MTKLSKDYSRLADHLSLCGHIPSARQLGQEYQHGSTVRQLGMNASSAQKHSTAKPFLVSDQNAEGRVGHHLPLGNTARPDRYEHSFMTIGSLIYGDKKLDLSAMYIN